MFAGQWRSNDAIQKILKMPETAQRLESEGVVPAVEETPAKFEALIKAGVGIWAKVAAAAGMNRIKLYARGLSFRPSYVARFPML